MYLILKIFTVKKTHTKNRAYEKNRVEADWIPIRLCSQDLAKSLPILLKYELNWIFPGPDAPESLWSTSKQSLPWAQLFLVEESPWRRFLLKRLDLSKWEIWPRGAPLCHFFCLFSSKLKRTCIFIITYSAPNMVETEATKPVTSCNKRHFYTILGFFLKVFIFY